MAVFPSLNLIFYFISVIHEEHRHRFRPMAVAITPCCHRIRMLVRGRRKRNVLNGETAVSPSAISMIQSARMDQAGWRRARTTVKTSQLGKFVLTFSLPLQLE